MLETAIYDLYINIINLFVAETKSQFARDDPAFLVLFAGWLLSKLKKNVDIRKFKLFF